MNPTDAQYDAARAWLEAHVKGWTVGQWMLLAMLLAEQEPPPPAGPSSAPPPFARGIYLVSTPEWNEEKHPECETHVSEIAAGSADELERLRLVRASFLGVTPASLVVIGRWHDVTARRREFLALVPYAQLPDYAKQLIDAQREEMLAKPAPRARKGRAA